MAPRRILGWVSVGALSVCLWTGCTHKGDAAKKDVSADLATRCEQLGKACGDGDKHVQTIVQECKQAVPAQVESGCGKEVMAVYDCYQKELCGKADKVWALDDLRVLSDRHGKCVAERQASQTCDQKGQGD